MAEYQENSIVQSVEPLADSFYRLTLSCSPDLLPSARPGQFVMAACGPSLDPLLRRPFSIHRQIGSDQIQLLFRVVGRGTQLLSEVLPGQSISLIGPLGRGFHLTPEPLPLSHRRRHRHRPFALSRRPATRLLPICRLVALSCLDRAPVMN